MARQNITRHNEANYCEKITFGSIPNDTAAAGDFLHGY